MIRKLFVGVAIVGLMSLSVALSEYSVHAQSQSDRSDKQEQKASKSVSGKVLKVGNSGHSLSVEVAGENKNSTEFVEFVVDKNTKVNGQVKEGTAVTVEYQAMESGQNLAVSITAQA
jgi:hypothetical protein